MNRKEANELAKSIQAKYPWHDVHVRSALDGPHCYVLLVNKIDGNILRLWSNGDTEGLENRVGLGVKDAVSACVFLRRAFDDLDTRLTKLETGEEIGRDQSNEPDSD